MASVTYQLQRSTGESWSDVGSAQAVPTSSTPESYTWENLPTYSAAGKEYAYRAIETAVTLTAAAGGSTINVVPAADLTSGTVGGFDYASTTTGSNLSGWTTAITNSARVTSVSATKAWADDSNRDGVRPESVTFHLWQGTDANSMKTAQTYANLHGDIGAVAEKLCQHPNTIRYRLKKIKDLLGLADISDRELASFLTVVFLPNRQTVR